MPTLSLRAALALATVSWSRLRKRILQFSPFELLAGDRAIHQQPDYPNRAGEGQGGRNVAGSEALSKGPLERADRARREKFETIFAGKAAGGDDASDDPIQAPVSDHHVSRIADLVVESGKFSSRAEALHHLMNTAHGAVLLHRVRTAKKDEPMDTVYSIMKSAGIGATCAAIVAKGSTSLTELEIVEAATAVASERHSNMSPAQAFDKIYSDPGDEGRVLRQAINVAKSMPVTPSVAVGPDAFPSTRMRPGSATTTREDDSTLRDESDAYEQLTRLAEKMREAAPELKLSAAQAFDKVFTDPKNAALAAAAHRRPAATTFFPMPR
jgi:hypothetical protein